MTRKNVKNRTRKSISKKTGQGRKFLLLLLAFGILFLFTYLIGKFDEVDIIKRQLQMNRVVVEPTVVVDANTLSPSEQVIHFGTTFGILPRLLRINRSNNIYTVQMPVNFSVVDLNFTNFQLTRYLTSLGWRQVSGVEPNQNLQVLTFLSPVDSTTYRFRIFYDRTGAYPQQRPRIAIIVQGFGNLNAAELERWLTLNNSICYSVLPINRVSRMNIQQIVNHNFEALIELPLEDPGHPVIPTESFAIFAHFRDSEVIARLDQYFRLLPSASGVITHRGGLVTTDRRIMPIILNYIKERELYFVDNRAIETSIAFTLAQQMMIVSYERSITLNPSHYADDRNNVRLLRDLRNVNRNPMIITLQRPDDATFEFVQRLVNVAMNNGFEIVRVSEL